MNKEQCNCVNLRWFLPNFRTKFFFSCVKPVRGTDYIWECHSASFNTNTRISFCPARTHTDTLTSTYSLLRKRPCGALVQNKPEKVWSGPDPRLKMETSLLSRFDSKPLRQAGRGRRMKRVQGKEHESSSNQHHTLKVLSCIRFISRVTTSSSGHLFTSKSRINQIPEAWLH